MSTLAVLPHPTPSRLPTDDGLRRGWCPGALRPMAAKDGLLVRLRITGGLLAADQGRAIADLAERDGNGVFDLTSRGNLQFRGIAEARWPTLVEDLRCLGLVDDDAEAEAVRNVVASPLCGLHGGLDIRPLVVALEAALVGDPTLHRLPAKFGFLLDDGMPPSLADVAADLRFDWLPDREMFSIGLGGTRAEALRVGMCTPADLVTRARDVALGAIELFRSREGVRRLRALIDLCGSEAVAAACGGRPEPALAEGASIDARIAGMRCFGDRPVLCLAAPFGRLDTSMLRAAADAATKHGLVDLRLTPWRVILLPGATPDAADLAGLRRVGFCLDPADPRLDVVACVGRDGCARGTTPTHADAARLADLARVTGAPLHVSGCVKGCARAQAAPVTLVARDGRYDLVQNGRAADPPVVRGLDLAGVRALLAT